MTKSPDTLRRLERAAMRWYYALEALEKAEIVEHGGSPMENLDEAAVEAENELDLACAAHAKAWAGRGRK